jgi:uncharacterized damage-inducible protein DinB
VSFLRDLLPEFDEEMKTTRRLIERVPTEKGEWKPHPKSFSLGHLAQLVATMPGWLIRMLGESELDLAASPGYSYEATETLLAQFDKMVADARATLMAAKDESMAEPWSLRMGEHVLFTMPRQQVVRTHINHIVHHRGQLSVYLRLLDVPVPSIYGPTADEKW